MTSLPNRYILLLLLIASVAFTACGRAARSELAPSPTPTRIRPTSVPTRVLPTLGATAITPDGDRAEVTYVFDGDTIEVELDGQTYRLRYIGVDTPERDEPFYEEALTFNRELVDGQTVILVRDVSETDQYGRLLRYVYLTDGTFVNAELMRAGMARLVTFPPDVAQTDFLRALQQEARAAAAGMWAQPALVGPCDCDRNLYDCRDFSTQAEAQTCFAYCLETVGEDVHRLDGGGDGFVCESLP
ncbi:thermonuclease family protein [Promineifilum sp.]|uniref:thermonuclease family protein n=1 Tax=Promineifilum sp. TaxID=2664178 RepID=UPI0035B1531D